MIIGKTACKKEVLEVLALLRPGLKDKLTRVSGSVYEHLEQIVKAEIRKLVTNHPSKGKTVTVGNQGLE